MADSDSLLFNGILDITDIIKSALLFISIFRFFNSSELSGINRTNIFLRSSHSLLVSSKLQISFSFTKAEL